MRELPEIEFNKNVVNPLKIEVIPFEELKKIYQKPLNHDPFQPHKLKFNAILFIIDGEDGTHNIDFESYTYTRGSIILISKEQIHQFVSLPEKNRGFLLVFTEELFLKVGASLPFLINHLYNSQLYSPVLNLGIEKFEELQILFSKIKNEITFKKPVNNEIAKSYFKILLLEIFQLREKENNKINKSPYLEDFIKFKKVKFYAEQLNITPKKLNVITQSTINLSAKDFILSTVILEAKKYLKCSDLTSKEVAYKLGFDEPTNFTKFFKKHTQMLPSEFTS